MFNVLILTLTLRKHFRWSSGAIGNNSAAAQISDQARGMMLRISTFVISLIIDVDARRYVGSETG